MIGSENMELTGQKNAFYYKYAHVYGTFTLLYFVALFHWERSVNCENRKKEIQWNIIILISHCIIARTYSHLHSHKRTSFAH